MRRLGHFTGLLAVVALCACATHQGNTMTGADIGIQGAPGAPGTTVAAQASAVPSIGSAWTGVTGTTNGMTTESNGSSAKKVDCSAVRCLACPVGQHPLLLPPDCCRCVPG